MSYKDLNQKPVEYKHCISCGWKIPVSSSQCPYCKKEQFKRETKPMIPSKPSTSGERVGWFFLYVLALMSSFVGLFLCIIFYNSGEKQVAKNILKAMLWGIVIKFALLVINAVI